MKATKQEQQDAIERLKSWLKPGDTVYCSIGHVARSGMSRTIKFFFFTVDEENAVRVINLTYNMSRALGDSMDRDEGTLKVSGCGMDMGFETIYRLGALLWPTGFDCIGKHCPSNDHTNGDKGTHHNDGGYALRQSWL
jgi:hypothetical protein